MPEELLDRVKREIRERRVRAQAAYEESRQLESALQALEGQPRPPQQLGGHHGSARRHIRTRAAALFAGALPATLRLTTAAAALAGTGLAGLVGLAPAAWLRRVPTVPLLAGE